MLAGVTQTPELLLDQDEAKRLAHASASVAAFYNVEASAKALAWTNLAMTAGAIYGTRLLAIRMRTKSEQPQRSATVTEIRPSPRAASPSGHIPGIGDVFTPELKS
jgi:hypothetical protein